ncbi:MAG: hypothetical protein ACFBSD_11365 [Paracoccaceae bacterium]
MMMHNDTDFEIAAPTFRSAEGQINTEAAMAAGRRARAEAMLAAIRMVRHALGRLAARGVGRG